jgi:hypothetical protein
MNLEAKRPAGISPTTVVQINRGIGYYSPDRKNIDELGFREKKGNEHLDFRFNSVLGPDSENKSSFDYSVCNGACIFFRSKETGEDMSILIHLLPTSSIIEKYFDDTLKTNQNSVLKAIQKMVELKPEEVTLVTFGSTVIYKPEREYFNTELKKLIKNHGVKIEDEIDHPPSTNGLTHVVVETIARKVTVIRQNASDPGLKTDLEIK